jgi:hypothetical protein
MFQPAPPLIRRDGAVEVSLCAIPAGSGRQSGEFATSVNSRVTSRQIGQRPGAGASAPESLEATARDPGVMGGVLRVAVSEVILDQAEIVTAVGEVEAARVAQHVRMDGR